MKILVTNDDGIRSEGIAVLARFAARLGEVLVVAPSKGQSGKAMAINLDGPFGVREEAVLPGFRCISVDSSPADCVRYAICGLEEHFDLVLAGINNGLNLGHDIAYSGTVACAFEAAYWKIPAVAVSTDFNDFAPAEQALDRVLAYFREHELLKKHHLYNVNIPFEAGEIRMTRQCPQPFYLDHFPSVGEGMVIADGYRAYSGSGQPDWDLDAALAGFISVSPLCEYRTDEDAFRRLKAEGL